MKKKTTEEQKFNNSAVEKEIIISNFKQGQGKGWIRNRIRIYNLGWIRIRVKGTRIRNEHNFFYRK